MIQDRLHRPLRDLRISLSDVCNLRCAYCLPAEPSHSQATGSPHRHLSFEEIVRVVRACRRLGLRKIKLTGGEPLTRAGVPDLIQRIKQAEPDLEVGMITNGLLLEPLLDDLIAAGLDALTISLDTLRPERWRALAGRDAISGGPEAVRAAIERACQRLPLVKVNMVPIRGLNDDEIETMATAWNRPGVALRFIEFMDVGTVNHWSRNQVVPSSDIRSRLFALGGMLPLPARHEGETAERWQWVHGGGEVGFISSITEPFCQDCSRARLSVGGIVYTCLFAGNGLDLKPVLGAANLDIELVEQIRACWERRDDHYSELRTLEAPAPHRGDRIEMYAIGG